MTVQQPNSFRTGPDERGHFGIFGGRFVAETLMPLILELEKAYAAAKDDPVDLLALDDALQKLEAQHPQKAQIVKLRFFAGCTLEETAQLLGISRATAQRHWAYARAWLFGQLNQP